VACPEFKLKEVPTEAALLLLLRVKGQILRNERLNSFDSKLIANRRAHLLVMLDLVELLALAPRHPPCPLIDRAGAVALGGTLRPRGWRSCPRCQPPDQR